MASTPSGLPTYLLCQRCATRIGTLAKANNPCGYWEKWRRWDSNPRPPACKIDKTRGVDLGLACLCRSAGVRPDAPCGVVGHTEGGKVEFG